MAGFGGDKLVIKTYEPAYPVALVDRIDKGVQLLREGGKGATQYVNGLQSRERQLVHALFTGTARVPRAARKLILPGDPFS